MIKILGIYISQERTGVVTIWDIIIFLFCTIENWKLIMYPVRKMNHKIVYAKTVYVDFCQISD